MWHERIARECAGNAARKLLAGRDDLHPEEWNKQFGAISLLVEIEIQNYAKQVEAIQRRLYPLRNREAREQGR